MPSSGVQTCADRKSTRLNSSHTIISYAVFCLKKKTNNYVAVRAPHGTNTLSRPASPPRDSQRNCSGEREHNSRAMDSGRTKLILFFFNDTATTEIYTLSLPPALPI